jgi:hypothetical protein
LEEEKGIAVFAGISILRVAVADSAGRRGSTRRKRRKRRATKDSTRSTQRFERVRGDREREMAVADSAGDLTPCPLSHEERGSGVAVFATILHFVRSPDDGADGPSSRW